MTTIRVKKDERYFSASNEPFNDKRLSWEARGLMGYLLSKPNNWKIRMNDLEKQGPAGGRKLKRMLAELRLYGYMNRIRTKLENGKFDWTTDVYESPSQNPNPNRGVIVTSVSKRTSAKRTSSKPRNIVKTDPPKTNPPLKGEGASATPKASDIPELVIYKNVVDHFPKKHQRDMVIGAVQKISARLGRAVTVEDLQPFFMAWGKVSANDWSLVWLVDWAVPGTINGKVNYANNTKPVEQKPPSAEAIRRAELINERRAAGLSV